MVLGRCTFSRFCAKTVLKLCSRSLHLSLRSTAQSFEQGDLAACEVKSAFGWWVRFWRAGIEHGSLYLCKTNTEWYLLLKVNSLLSTGKLGLFMVLGRCAFSRFWANDDQSWTTRLRSSQSLCLSLRSTALFFFAILHLVPYIHPYTKIWKWNETAFIWGASSKDFGCLMERRVCFANWWDRFWKADNWYWTWKSLC